MSVRNWDLENFKPQLPKRFTDDRTVRTTEKTVSLDWDILCVTYRVTNAGYEDVFEEKHILRNNNYELYYWAHWIENSIISGRIDFMSYYADNSGRLVDKRKRKITALELKDGELFVETTVRDCFGINSIEHTKHTSFVASVEDDTNVVIDLM